MRKTILLMAVILLSAVSFAQAQEGGLHGAIDLTYQSKYIWRGFDVYGDKSAIQPAIDLDLYGSGFGISAVGHRANSDKYELNERWDYSLYYGSKLFEAETYATDYRLSWVYYNYPDRSSHSTSTVGAAIDLQELNGVFSWPSLLGVKGLVPSYVLVKLWPSNSSSIVGSPKSNGTASGFAHIFMLDYGMPIEGLLPDIPEQVLNLHAEVVYNDGADHSGGLRNVDHDWSNAVFGVSTDFDLGNNLTFTPGVYHQITMDKSVNPDKDETWANLSMKYRF